MKYYNSFFLYYVIDINQPAVQQGGFLLDHSDQQKQFATGTLSSDFNLRPVISNYADEPKIVGGGAQLNQTGIIFFVHPFIKKNINS